MELSYLCIMTVYLYIDICLILLIVPCQSSVQLIWLNGFREEFWLGQSQTRTAYGGHISCMMDTKYSNLVQDLPDIIPTKEQLIVPPSLRG